MPSESKTPETVRAGKETEAPLKKRAVTLYAIIIFKLIKGVLCIALAIVLYNEADNNISADYQKLLQRPSVKFIFDHLKIHPENKFFSSLAEKVENLTEAKVDHFALGALFLSLFPLIEGTGMLFRVSWAGWLAIGESAFFVPIEFYRLAVEPKFSLFILLVTIVNIIIVTYLYAYRNVLFHHHHGST